MKTTEQKLIEKQRELIKGLKPKLPDKDGWSYNYFFLKGIKQRIDESQDNEAISLEQIESVLMSLYKGFESEIVSLEDELKEQEDCDCTHTQACKKCAERKDIDWSIIERAKEVKQDFAGDYDLVAKFPEQKTIHSQFQPDKICGHENTEQVGELFMRQCRDCGHYMLDNS
jgi:hypothetical protein